MPTTSTPYRLVKKALADDARVQKQPEPVVGVQAMTVDGVVLIVLFWVTPTPMAPCRWM